MTAGCRNLGGYSGPSMSDGWRRPEGLAPSLRAALSALAFVGACTGAHRGSPRCWLSCGAFDDEGEGRGRSRFKGHTVGVLALHRAILRYPCDPHAVIASLDVVELESVVAGDGGLRSLVDGDGITVGIRAGPPVAIVSLILPVVGAWMSPPPQLSPVSIAPAVRKFRTPCRSALRLHSSIGPSGVDCLPLLTLTHAPGLPPDVKRA